MEKKKLEQRFLDELRKMGYKEFTDENYVDVWTDLLSMDGDLGNAQPRTKAIEEELNTVYDFLNFLDEMDEADQILDYDWINEQLRK